MNDRVVAIINLKNLLNNILSVKETLGTDVRIMSVLKANAYGLGAVDIAKYIEYYIDYVAVATIDEGIELRENGINKPILILGGVPDEKLANSIEYNLMSTIFSEECFNKYISYAKKYGKVLSVHIAIDTGMNRIGIKYNDYATIINVFTSEYLKIEGIYSHLAKADDEKYTSMQNERFDSVIEKLKNNNIKIPLRHIANSYGAKNKLLHKDCVRLGISQFVSQQNQEPVLKLLAKIVQIKKVNKGESIGYDCSYIAETDRIIATLSIGYADGLMRSLSNKGKVVVADKLCDIVGKVCMDYTMVDVTFIKNIKIGDYATVIGENGVDIDSVANLANTISYEIFSNLSKRIKKYIIY
jgi:alanine racemase